MGNASKLVNALLELHVADERWERVNAEAAQAAATRSASTQCVLALLHTLQLTAVYHNGWVYRAVQEADGIRLVGENVPNSWNLQYDEEKATRPSCTTDVLTITSPPGADGGNAAKEG